MNWRVGGQGAPVTATTEVMINTATAIMPRDPRLSVKQLANIPCVYIYWQRLHNFVRLFAHATQWKLHHNNAPPHVANVVLELWLKKAFHHITPRIQSTPRIMRLLAVS